MTPDDTHHHPVVHQALDKFEERLDNQREIYHDMQNDLTTLANNVTEHMRATDRLVKVIAQTRTELSAKDRAIEAAVQGHSKLLFLLALSTAVNGVALLLLAVLSS
jgi:Mg-chelatase subunit ChlI